MTKRTSVRGKGIDTFLAPEEVRPGTEQRRGREAKEHRKIMVTFWLTPDIVERLDDTWMGRRKKDRRTHKSQIVQEALQAYLK